jgi:hypothetical protein
MNTSMNQTLLRRILYSNAMFSGVSGLLFIIASRPIANFMGLDASLAVLVPGIGLVGYAALIYTNVSSAEISPSFVFFAIIGDSSWVLLSILLLVTGWVPFSMEGK